MLTKNELVERMLRPINQPVSYTYPGTDGPLRGVLKDRAVIRGGDAAGAKYWDVVDLIHFGTKRSDRCMRISYYRQVGDKLGWASKPASLNHFMSGNACSSRPGILTNNGSAICCSLRSKRFNRNGPHNKSLDASGGSVFRN